MDEVGRQKWLGAPAEEKSFPREKGARETTVSHLQQPKLTPNWRQSIRRRTLDLRTWEQCSRSQCPSSDKGKRMIGNWEHGRANMLAIGATLAIVAVVLTSTGAERIDEHCRLSEKKTKITCRCTGNEEFFLPEGFNYENVTSVWISSCESANLHFSSLPEASRLADISIQNISERLNLELFLSSRAIARFRLSNIGRIPLITHDTFTSLTSIGSLELENLLVESLEEQFDAIEVKNFLVTNVTIERTEGVNFSERGERLRIVNSKFLNVGGSLNFAFFADVLIENSSFELQKPGHLSIESDAAAIASSVFLNVSMNVVATKGIFMNATCADGKSSLRLSSDRIESYANRLPTEIVYTGNMQRHTTELRNRDNTVCIAGNCKCPKSSGQGSHRPYSFLPLLGIAWMLLSRSSF
ncbi:hypothetical protein KM043_004267 [Ampulex compressa]|nr:hypothetical protein KM043_004267 [Ampulex compressa]